MIGVWVAAGLPLLVAGVLREPLAPVLPWSVAAGAGWFGLEVFLQAAADQPRWEKPFHLVAGVLGGWAAVALVLAVVAAMGGP